MSQEIFSIGQAYNHLVGTVVELVVLSRGAKTTAYAVIESMKTKNKIDKFTRRPTGDLETVCVFSKCTKNGKIYKWGGDLGLGEAVKPEDINNLLSKNDPGSFLLIESMASREYERKIRIAHRPGKVKVGKISTDGVQTGKDKRRAKHLREEIRRMTSELENLKKKHGEDVGK